MTTDDNPPSDADRADDAKPNNNPSSNPRGAAQPHGNVGDSPQPEDEESRAKQEEDTFDKYLDRFLDRLAQKSLGATFNFYNSKIDNSAFGNGARTFNSSSPPKNYNPENSKPTESSETNWLEWFRHKKIQEQVFAVTLVFFSGNSPKFVENSAFDLLKFMGVSIKPPEITSSIFDKGISINGFLQDGFAKIIKSSLGTEAGKLPYDAIVVEDQSALLLIQEKVAKDYDLVSFRSNLKRWLSVMAKYDDNKLRLLGSSSPDLTRIEAAWSLGVLARSDFDDVLSSVIRPWAGSEILAERLMVGWVLLGYFEETNQTEYWSKASSLLKHWSTLDNYYLRWTAIASTTRLGLIVSPEDDSSLELSMSIFKEACRSGRPRLHWGVMLKSLRFLFGFSFYHAKSITVELSSWVKEDNHILQDVASRFFIEIVNVAVSDGETSATIWDMCEQESYVVSDSVYSLIRQALMHQSGSFVDYAVNQISKSMQLFLDNNLHACNSFKDVIAQLQADKQTARYVPLILGSYQNRI